MLKVFNNSGSKYLLEANGKQLVVAPGKFVNVDESYRSDVTFRMAVALGALKIYDDVKAAEKLIEEHEQTQPEDPTPPETIEDKAPEKTKTTRTRK